MNQPRRLARFLILGLLAAGCRGVDLPAPAREPAQVVPREPAPTPEPAQDPLETIARFEEARSDGGGLLELLLVRGEPETRVRAALALGRLPPGQGGSAVRDALAGALDDPEPSVRAAAAFGIGLRADPASAGALLGHASDSDATVRARIVEAASRVDDPRMVGLVLGALEDAEPAVRAEAAVAPQRWIGERAKQGGDAALVDAALVAIASPATADGGQPVEVVRAALFSLARRKSEAGRALFASALGSEDAEQRIFACQGLAAVATDAELPGLRSALNAELQLANGDWRVACELAIALGKHPHVDSREPLVRAAFGHVVRVHRSAHVRRSALEALGEFTPVALREPEESDNWSVHRESSWFLPAMKDSSANVRAAALVALARTSPADATKPVLAAAEDTDPLLRAGAAAALAYLTGEKTREALLRLTADANLRVAGIAIASAGERIAEKPLRARLVELLTDADNGLRLAAVEGLRKKPLESDLGPLAASFASARGEISSELSFTILATAAEIGGPHALALLQKGLEHPDPYVRRKARELVAAKFPATSLPPPRNGQARAEDRARPVWTSHPEVEIVTSRGTMRFELLSDETPRHVESFLALAARDFYDGLSFHRVVPDFVIQGGDPRGDGNGGSAANGGSLAAEFTPRKFVRGALGMPRNEDPDSGGAQIFVTHRATPHLDGRYTLFGLLREGFDVLDAIEVGDTIVDVRIVKDGK